MKTMTAKDRLQAAVQAWRMELGGSSVDVDGEILRYWGRTTAWKSPQPLAVLRARSTAEVVGVLRIASRYRVPVYPVSRGKNWGQGDACPAQDGQVLLDLSSMNRIVEVNPQLAYAVVEPGVTQRQLAEELGESESLTLDVTASSADSSLLGNYIERGDGFSVYGDRFNHCCGMEVVLADGTIIETGYARFSQPGEPGCKYLSKWGTGPSLDGLFSQSNLGVVTRLGIWLVRKPACVVGFFAGVSDSQLPEVMNRLRELHLTGVLQNPIHLYNSTRVIQAGSPIDGTRSSESKITEHPLANYGDWILWGGFFGSRQLSRERLRATRHRLRGFSRVYAVTESKLKWLKRLSMSLQFIGMQDLASRCRSIHETVADGMDKLLGRPSDNAVRSVCARFSGLEAFNESRPADLLDHNVGLYWVTHLCPLTASSIQCAVRLTKEIVLECNLEPHITLTVINSRSALCNVTLYFDRSDPHAAEAADKCRAVLTGRLIEAGFPPYRLGIHSMDTVNPIGENQAGLMQKIKSVLDPHNVLAPGRYVPRHPE